jgi:hypothetical protein
MSNVVLYSALDWGLGHCTRGVPLIKALQKAGKKVVIACNPQQQSFFETALEDVSYQMLEGYKIQYFRSIPAWMSIVLQFNKIKTAMKADAAAALKWSTYYQANIIISDNRFTFHVKGKRNIYLTHQVNIRAPLLPRLFRGLLSWWHAKYINKFDLLWIVDDEKINLAGELSKPNRFLKIPYKYTGLLSRLKTITTTGPPIDLLCLVSGPEPRRSIFEKRLLAMPYHGKRKVMVQGLTKGGAQPLTPEKNSYAHLTDHEMSKALQCSKLIICRSGYSTLMDLAIVGGTVLLVPTPGQTEQIYLAKWLHTQYQIQYTEEKKITTFNTQHLKDLVFPKLNGEDNLPTLIQLLDQ